ncbi:MAG: ribulose-phosphate 3-epimerase [Planctomycetota bacterium]
MATRKIIVSPSLLAADFTRLAEAVRAMEAAGADWHHVDVMDGHFVPNLTVGLPVVEALRREARIPLDVHIMIANPEDYAARYARAGAAIVTFHVEAAREPAAVAAAIRGEGARVGISLSPPTPIERLAPYLHLADLVLVMTVHPGFGGQVFMPEMLDKVRQVRYGWGFEGDVEVDGGLSAENVGVCAEAGANAFVAGTAILRSTHPAATVREFRERAARAIEER